MKKAEVIALHERIAALEVLVKAQAEQIQRVSTQHHLRDKMAVETWGRVTEMLHVAWEVLREVRLPAPPQSAGGDPDPLIPRSPSEERGLAEGD